MPLLLSKLLLVAAFLAFRSILAFQHINHVYHLPAKKITATPHRAYISLLLSGSSINPNDFETPQEREARMKLVQQIQKSFYRQDDQDLGAVSSNDPTVLENVPLWRVQWTELPGYQNILNCHVPHYTHMFHRVLSKPRPWLFGHVFLPGGSENLNNPMYRLPSKDDHDDSDDNRNEISSPSQAALIGTLMQVSDYQQLPDGRLALIVQALERFEILYATQSLPYAIATVQLKPDLEAKTTTVVAAAAAAANMTSTMEQQAIRENEEWRDWEFRRTLWEEVSSDSTSGGGVSPLVNYDGNYFPNELLLSPPCEGSTPDERLVANLEHKVWVALDRMISLLAKINQGLRIPIPSQLLGLLPINESWPKGFQLKQHAAQLLKNNAEIGTSTKSPFVRIAENASYPSRRRAARLSYVIWIILDSIALPGSPSRQELLEETSIAKRLKMAHEQLEAVNNSLNRLG